MSNKYQMASNITIKQLSTGDQRDNATSVGGCWQHKRRKCHQ